MSIWLDADACPKTVRELVSRAAIRHQQHCFFVANHFIVVPESPWLRSVQVEHGFDEADNYLVEHCAEQDLLVTADLALAERVMDKLNQVYILNFAGEWLDRSLKQKLAMRKLMQALFDDSAQHRSSRSQGFNHKTSKAFADELNRYLQNRTAKG